MKKPAKKSGTDAGRAASLRKRQEAQRRAKEVFLQIFRKQAGNVTEAAKAANITRKTYYEWCRDDPAFAEAADDVKETLLDFTESKLMKNIDDGKEISIFFYLKCKGKARGYVEKAEVEGDRKHEVTIIREIVSGSSVNKD